jgi:uncharacterized protein (TIGR03545 family)
MGKLLRPRALIVFALLLALVAGAWWLYADRLVQRGVEATGESIVGARVELAEVDLQATAGMIRMRGLQVANPDAPMTNLLEAADIVVDLMLAPALEKKIVVENLVATGVRFNTPRETSGALENPDPEAGQLWRNVNAWADQIQLPEFSLETLTGVVRTDALDADSLRTVQYARALVGRADSLRTSWEARLVSLDPRPRIDSVRALVTRLEGFRPTPLNAAQVPGLVRDARAALENVTSLQTEVASLDDAVRSGIASLDVGPERLAELRQADLAYARGLLNIPSLEAPTISPALFGGTALTWLKPVLFWAQTAERYLPPGLDPRTRPGAQRARAEGVTVEFPRDARWPGFLLQRGELGLEIGGTGFAAGTYTALISGLTTSPSQLGAPLEITLDRSAAAQGPTGLSLAAVLDHTTEAIRDSVGVSLSGIDLPEIDLPALGGRLGLDAGESTLRFLRTSDEIDAVLRWSSSQISWTGAESAAAGPAPALGSADWARALLGRTLSGLGTVELEMGLRGNLDSPSLSVSSNLGEAVAASLRRELGAEIENAETRLREEVDQRIQPLVQDARTRVEGIRTQVGEQVAEQRRQIEALRTQLEQRIQALTGGIQLPIPG